MRIDLVALHQNFALEGDRLVRIMSNGARRKVVSVVNNKIRIQLDGVYLPGPEVAWALHYKVEPQFPILQVDGNPFNLSLKNLLPIRGAFPRCRMVKKGLLYFHPLNKSGYGDAKTCQKSWQHDVFEKYSKDLAYVLTLEASIRTQRGMLLVPPKPVRKYFKPSGKKPKVERPPKPEHVDGRVWVWFEEAWLSIPEAIHPSDDWMVRAAAVKAGLSVRYDSGRQQTLPAGAQAQPA